MTSTIIWAVALVIVALIVVVGAVAVWFALRVEGPFEEQIERIAAYRERSRPEQRAEADRAAMALDATANGAVADDGAGLGLVVGGGDAQVTATRTGSAGALGASGVGAHDDDRTSRPGRGHA